MLTLAGLLAVGLGFAAPAFAGPNPGLHPNSGVFKPQAAPFKAPVKTQHIQVRPNLTNDAIPLTIEGEIVLRHAPLSAFYFKINGRRANPASIRFSNIGGEFSNRYHFKITTHLRGRSFTITPAFNSSYTVHGQWNPRDNIIRMPVSKSVRGLVFRWRESVHTSSIASSLVLGLIDRTLRGLKIHLNNHGAQHPDSVHSRSWQHNDSYIGFQGTRIGLIQNEIANKIANRHYYYYVNDFNLHNVDVSTERGMIRLAFNFEDQGPEVKGHCLVKRKKFLGGWSACPLGSDKAAPDINLTHPTFVVLAQPSAVGGSISFGDIDVRYTGGVRVNGILRVISPLATKMMRKAIHKGMTDMLSRGSLRGMIAANIRHTLDGLHVGYVTSVHLNGRNFVVTSRN